MTDLFTIVDGPEPVGEVDPKTLATIGKALHGLPAGKRLEFAKDKFATLGVSARDLGEGLRGAGYEARVQARKDGSVHVLRAKPKPAKPTVPAPGLPK